MSETNPNERLSTKQLIFAPAVISLAVTLVRLGGELRHWSKTYFNTEVGGGGAIIGITWLAPIFGIYFAVRLAAGGEGPRSAWRAIGFALLGAIIIFGSFRVQKLVLPSAPTFQVRLLYIWTMVALAGLVTLPGWPRLWKTILAYAYAARVPVTIIMFFAFAGNWGTHYDALPPDFTGTSLMSKWLWLGFVPQLVFWGGFHARGRHALRKHRRRRHSPVPPGACHSLTLRQCDRRSISDIRGREPGGLLLSIRPAPA